MAARPFLPVGAQIGWIDLAKGLGIVLVVVGHAWRGLNGAGLIGDAALYAAVDRVIYAFHMPLFFFLSGLFLERAVSSRSLGRITTSRVQRLLWPLALWTWIFFAFKALGGGAVNTPVGVETFPVVPLPPRLHMWFLWALFLIHMLVALLWPLVGRFAAAAWFWVGAGLIAVALAMLVRPATAPWPWIGPACYHLIFLILGMAAARFAVWPVGRAGKRALAAGALAVFLACAVIAAQVRPGWLAGLGLSAAMMLAFVVLCHGLWAVLHGTGTGRMGELLGRHSLAIYLAHTIFSAALRIALLAVGVTALWLHMLLGVAIGLAGPLAVVVISQRLGIERLLGLRG